MARKIGYLGLGSNIGDRQANLQRAVTELVAGGLLVTATSSIYETEPVGEILDQRDFYNACIQIETALSPDALLSLCKGVEQRLGREQAAVRHAPRVIDIDLLLLGDSTYRSERLVLPHRETTTRRFVLTPLLEINPELVIPGYGLAADALASLPAGQAVQLVDKPLVCA